MKHITEHMVNPANEQLKITTIDDPGAGGANNRYDITGFNTEGNPSATIDGYSVNFTRSILIFQNGPIDVVGVNGITHEALIAILLDRLRCFQTGAFANEYNAEAIEGLEIAQKALHSRTKLRTERGVEGTHIV
jgi:hypothetical protein